VKGFGRHFDLATQREAQTAGERLYVNFTPALRHGFFRPLVRGVLRYIEPSTGQALDTLLDEPELRPTTDRLSPRAAGQLLRILAPLARGLILALRRPEARRRQAQQRIEEAVAEVRRRMVEAPSLAQQLAVWESAYDIIPDVGLPLLFPVVAAGIGSFFQLRRLANKHLASDQLALEAARGLPNNVTTEMDLALWTVAQIIGRDGESRSRFRRETPAELAQDCRAGRLPVPAQAALAAFLDRYGARGLAEIDLARPRWRDDPTHIMQVVQSYLQIEDPTQAPDHVFRQGAQAAQSAIDQLVAAMPNPVEARMARLFATRMRALAGLREYPKFMIMQLMGIMRSALLKRGPELVAAGVLERPDDLFFLRFAELKALAAGDASSDGRVWRGLVAERRQRYEREMRRNQVPRLLLSDGRAFYAGMTGDGGEAGDTMSGSPVSPGVVEGTVRVVFDPHDAQLAPGEILVCPGTDPSWTPLFLAAGGLVMEVGGLMTHGSVVAREYGIPAVVGVHRATERLHTGQRVRVDGSSGRIELLDGQGA